MARIKPQKVEIKKNPGLRRCPKCDTIMAESNRKFVCRNIDCRFKLYKHKHAVKEDIEKEEIICNA